MFALLSQNILIILVFAFGFLSITLSALVLKFIKRFQAEAEAKHIIDDATEHAQEIEDQSKRKAQEYIDKITEKNEAEIAVIEERIEALQQKVDEKESRLEESFKDKNDGVSELQSDVDSNDHRLKSNDQKLGAKKSHIVTLKEDYIKKLEAKTEESTSALTLVITEKLINDKKIDTAKQIQILDEKWQVEVEIEAKKLLTLAINRFARAYCPERGIGYLNFESEEQQIRVLGENQINLRTVEKICGVDLAFDDNNKAVNVYGFDPVRRELGRATIDRLMTEKNITASRIEQIVVQVKKDLFQRILNDGNRVTNELKIEGLNQEIKNMMGALRYRYSFTQNQYFHCAEVGFLCGLLGAELEVPIKDARRAGLLHDIGKAMDHSVDGGHAMIGADFIQKNGEKDHIVHAVRSHHFDEQPNSELAYLVIAADAISGARPGARRSTVANYTQKIQDLQSIARGFEGVFDTHVLSAGREIRVYVDGKKVDDLRALDLSKEIAHKIESDMQYPGQIRVTVVRETQAIEYAR
jgi:ribonuclease Y